ISYWVSTRSRISQPYRPGVFGDRCLARRTRRSPANTELRDRTKINSSSPTRQSGTLGVLASSKHARRRAAWATPRTGDRGHIPRGRPLGAIDRRADDADFSPLLAQTVAGMPPVPVQIDAVR